MENTKVRTFIMHPYKKDVIEPLINEAKKFENVEIVGTGPHNKSTIQNLSLNQPDVLISGLISVEEIEQITHLIPDIQIIILTNNPNMGKDLIDKAQAKNLYNVSDLDITDPENSGPRTVLELVSSNLEIKTPKKVSKRDKKDEDSGSVMEKGLKEFQDDKKVSNHEEKSVSRKEDRGPQDDEDDFESEKKYTKQQKENIAEAMSLQSKMITFYSLKGGVGTTTIAKEVANLYSGIRMPKQVKMGKSQFMKVALLDLDFDKGNLRSHLGFEKINPSVYVWVEDIIQKLENGVSINQIRYTNIQILSQFARKIDREFYAFTTGQGGFPNRLMNRLQAIDKKGDLALRVIEKILSSLRKAFHVVVVDTNSNLDEITQAALEESDNIALVTEPSISSLENTKVTLDEFKNFDNIDLSKISVIINKNYKKTGLEDDAEAILSTVTYKTFDFEQEEEREIALESILSIDHDEIIFRTANSFDFVTNLSPTNFKKDIIQICETFLPIFKVKPKRVLAQAKINNANLDKKEKAKRKKLMKEKAKARKKDKQNNQSKKTVVSDLSKMNLDQFISYLKTKDEVSKTVLGFPRVDSKPVGLNKKVWKKYLKKSTKELKRAKEARKRKEKAKKANENK